MRILPIVLGVLAAATVYPAWFGASGGATAAASTPETGKLGKPAAPDAIATLRVAEWDAALAEPKVLEVKRSGNDWVIPSHHGYPADANDRVSRAAARYLQLQHGRAVSEDPKDHVRLELVDPLDADPAASKEGRGRRVTMTDITGQVVADVIVGKKVDVADSARQDAPRAPLHFVREAGSNVAYTAQLDADLSTKFIDYVEPDPLKIKRDDVRALNVADYSVDEVRGAVELRSETPMKRAAGSETWETTAAVPADKRLAQAKATEILSGLTGLRLAGVRPFEPRRLLSRGFFFAAPGTIDASSPLVQTQEGTKAVVGNEGRLDVATRDGLRYSLLFGEVALDDAADIEADKAADAKPGEAPAKPGEPAKPDAAKGHNRYMVVFVTYDPALDEEAKAAAAEPEKKDDAAAKKAKNKSGKERAEKAQQRFLKYYYVISDESFKQLRPVADQLFEAKPPEPLAGDTGKTVTQWLADNGKRPEVTTTASGLQYEILASGPAGGKKARKEDRVQVRYKGTLLDGTEFDATPGDETREFGVSEVVKGWTEALQLMREGDKFKLAIKPELGYGEAGSPPKIPANAILIFEVEVVKVIGDGQPEAPAASATAPAVVPEPMPSATAASATAAPAK